MATVAVRQQQMRHGDKSTMDSLTATPSAGSFAESSVGFSAHRPGWRSTDARRWRVAVDLNPPAGRGHTSEGFTSPRFPPGPAAVAGEAAYSRPLVSPPI